MVINEDCINDVLLTMSVDRPVICFIRFVVFFKQRSDLSHFPGIGVATLLNGGVQNISYRFSYDRCRFLHKPWRQYIVAALFTDGFMRRALFLRKSREEQRGKFQFVSLPNFLRLCRQKNNSRSHANRQIPPDTQVP